MSVLSTSELGGMPVFRDLSVAELARITGYLHLRDVPGNSSIFAVEQPGEVVYVIREGTVKVHVEQADGSDVILALLGRARFWARLVLSTDLVVQQTRSR